MWLPQCSRKDVFLLGAGFSKVFLCFLEGVFLFGGFGKGQGRKANFSFSFNLIIEEKEKEHPASKEEHRQVGEGFK